MRILIRIFMLRISFDPKRLRDVRKYVEEPERAVEEYPELSILKEVARLLRLGYVATYPTDTVYGLGTRIYSKEGVEKIYELKRRPREKPVLIALRSRREIEKYAYVNDEARKFILENLPGPYSVVLKAKTSIPPRVSRESVGIRVPNCVISTILAFYAGPIVSTSANISGEKSPKTIEEALKADIVIDAGELLGKPSTVYDFTGEKPKVIRP